MFISCSFSRPDTVQKKQFKIDTTVKGKGMELAFLVCSTVLRVARGLANNMIQKITAVVPITEAGTLKDVATKDASTTAATPRT
jgi:hypothetical protein